jgi:hypothetical protein
MAYRPEWFEHKAKGRSVLAIAMDAHMGTTGACEFSPLDRADDISLLKWVLSSWQPAKHSVDFDEAVRKLIEASLREAGEL